MSPMGLQLRLSFSILRDMLGLMLSVQIDFHVRGGELQISSFATQEVRCLSLLATTIANSSSDEKRISFPLLYYVDYLI